MEFFDKLGKKASEAYKVTAEKTGKLTKEAKLRMKMNENKGDIEDLYKQIGKKVYERHTTDGKIDIKKDLEEECTKIDVLSAEIENILEEILSLKDMRQCPNCYEKIDKTAQYCPNCGAKQEVPEKPQENNYEGEDPEAKTAEVAKEKESVKEEPAKEVEIVDNKKDNE